MHLFSRPWSLREVLLLPLLVISCAWLGWRGVPVGLEVLTSRASAAHSAFLLPSAVDCRPVSVRLIAATDSLQTVWTFNAYLENWRGDLVVAVKGWNGKVGCPATPSPVWQVEPSIPLVVQPHFPNYAEAYPGAGDYLVTASFRLPDGETLVGKKTLHIPPRRKIQDALARRILEGGRP